MKNKDEDNYHQNIEMIFTNKETKERITIRVTLQQKDREKLTELFRNNKMIHVQFPFITTGFC